MQRYFIDSNVPESQKISIGIPHYHHIINVMRHVSGDQLIFVFNAGETYIVTIEEVEKETISCHLTERLEKTVELPIDVTLACGLPKGDKLDLIVQKTTELGIFSIQPFEAERSIVKWDEKKETKKTSTPSKNCSRGCRTITSCSCARNFTVVNIKKIVAGISTVYACFYC
ncbi:16S ribosomal RNA methyltransferase RsmE [Brochothrix thermosphacta DSM 20171 = FSL F6-1036]|nr:16S ribosomal RNA methyltransferase RsmE [Brochothrix thermosphacta DSM 20171 = FSL F6-1036]